MNRRIIIFLSILLLAVLLKLSFWADQRSFEVQGVVRMVVHPDGTLFLLTNDEIVHASPDGEVLSNWPLAGMGVMEPVADLAFGLEGQILVGLIESQEIRRYGQDGKFFGTVRRLPSPERVGVPGQHLRNFKFARDERTGTLYVADSNHHRIQIYPTGEGEPRILTSPSGTTAAREGEGGQRNLLMKNLSPAWTRTGLSAIPTRSPSTATGSMPRTRTIIGSSCSVSTGPSTALSRPRALPST